MEHTPNVENYSERVYKYPEIGDLEADTSALIERLKEKIDGKFYNLLVSDETGGRLPTLLVRSIIKKRHPDQELQTLFLNGGKMLRMLVDEDKPEEEASFVEYIKFTTEEHRNALVVTQVMRSGSSLAILASMLKQSGCDHVDVATVRSIFSDMIYPEDKKLIGDGDMFIGRTYANTDQFDDRNTEFSGVKKIEGSVVHPHSTKGMIDEDDTESRDRIQKTINEAREDIETMAEHIYKKVWTGKNF